VKQLVKKAMFAVAPQWATGYFSARSRAHSHAVIASWGCGPLNDLLMKKFGNRVQEGPFAGMLMSPMTMKEQIGPYFLGVYESELDGAWEKVLAKSFSQVIDIGAKFGYYAVGLARRYPEAEVVAFDTDTWARDAVREMAAANGTKNVKVEGFCSAAWLAANTKPGAFIISDCEGYEDALFTPPVLERLKTATLIVETHDCFVPGVSERLKSAFATTHDVQIFDDRNGRRNTTRDLSFLTERQRELSVKEVRPPQEWLLCLPRAQA
jgi:hypothetical protein